MHQHREPNHSPISLRSLGQILANIEESSPQMYFQEQKPGILFLSCDHRQTQLQEVPVKLHIWEVYFQGKGQSVRSNEHKNTLPLF